MDKVRPLKIESTTTGGGQNDASPVELNPTEDYVSAKGIAFEENDNRKIDLDASGNIQFKDATETTPVSVNQIKTAYVAPLAAVDAAKANISHTHIAADVSDFNAAAKSAAVNNTAYDATTWDAVTDIAPSKNAVRDQFETNIAAINGKENSLGNPSTNGHVLSSTTAGVRSWADSGKWTYSIRATDYTGISGTTLSTGFVSTPANALAPSKRYELHGKFWLSSSATTNGIKIGWTWLGSYSAPVLTGVFRFVGASAVTAEVLGYTTAAAPVTPVISGTGVPAATTWYLCTFDAIAEIDSNSSDARWHIALANELAPTNTCNLKAGSFIRWREII